MSFFAAGGRGSSARRSITAWMRLFASEGSFLNARSADGRMRTWYRFGRSGSGSCSCSCRLELGRSGKTEVAFDVVPGDGCLFELLSFSPCSVYGSDVSELCCVVMQSLELIGVDDGGDCAVSARQENRRLVRLVDQCRQRSAGLCDRYFAHVIILRDL